MSMDDGIYIRNNVYSNNVYVTRTNGVFLECFIE